MLLLLHINDWSLHMPPSMRTLLLLICVLAACVSRPGSTAHAAEPGTEAEIEMEEYNLFDPATLQDMVTDAFVERRKVNATEALDESSYLMNRAREAAVRRCVSRTPLVLCVTFVYI